MLLKSNIPVEVYASSTLTVNNPPHNTNDYKMTKQVWIDMQAKNPVIFELVQLWKDKRLGQREHQKEDSQELSF